MRTYRDVCVRRETVAARLSPQHVLHVADERRNRKAFKADEGKYLDQFPMSPEQRKAILDATGRDAAARGNIYYTSKLAASDGLTFQNIAAIMTGSTQEDYAKMMLAGGRSPEGNRNKSE